MVAVDAFLGHARHARGLSEQTLRAYANDLEQLVAFADGRGIDRVADVEARGSCVTGCGTPITAGLARSTIARRSSSVRAFTRWASETGVTTTDAGVRLRAPKGGSHLPRVVSADQVRALLDGLGARAATEDPTALRDLALVEAPVRGGHPGQRTRRDERDRRRSRTLDRAGARQGRQGTRGAVRGAGAGRTRGVARARTARPRGTGGGTGRHGAVPRRPRHPTRRPKCLPRGGAAAR